MQLPVQAKNNQLWRGTHRARRAERAATYVWAAPRPIVGPFCRMLALMFFVGTGSCTGELLEPFGQLLELCQTCCSFRPRLCPNFVRRTLSSESQLKVLSPISLGQGVCIQERFGSTLLISNNLGAMQFQFRVYFHVAPHRQGVTMPSNPKQS